MTGGLSARLLGELNPGTSSDGTGEATSLWREQKEAYVLGLRTMRPELLRPAIAEQVGDVRSIVAEHHRIGGELWRRISVSKWDIFWYYQECQRRYPRAVATEGLIGELGLECDRLASCMGEGFEPTRNAFVALADLAKREKWLEDDEFGNKECAEAIREIARGRHPDAPDWVFGNTRAKYFGRQFDREGEQSVEFGREEQVRLADIVVAAPIREVRAQSEMFEWIELYAIVFSLCAAIDREDLRLSQGVVAQFEREVHPELWRRRHEAWPATVLGEARTLTLESFRQLHELIKGTESYRRQGL